MAQSKAIKGVGTLVGANPESEDSTIEYNISVGTRRGIASGRGFIYASDEVLWSAFEDRKAIHILTKDGVLIVMVTNYVVESGRAEVATSGPIPGY